MAPHKFTHIALWLSGKPFGCGLDNKAYTVVRSHGGPTVIRKILLAAVFLIALPTAAQTAKSFEQANSRAEAQRQTRSAATSNYAETWAAFNNQHRLDERDGCYYMAEGELTQILEIDESGKVVSYFTDKDNGRSKCWAQTYLDVVFPKPPFAPYWHKLVMH